MGRRVAKQQSISCTRGLLMSQLIGAPAAPKLGVMNPSGPVRPSLQLYAHALRGEAGQAPVYVQKSSAYTYASMLPCHSVRNQLAAAATPRWSGACGAPVPSELLTRRCVLAASSAALRVRAQLGSRRWAGGDKGEAGICTHIRPLDVFGAAPKRH